MKRRKNNGRLFWPRTSPSSSCQPANPSAHQPIVPITPILPSFLSRTRTHAHTHTHTHTPAPSRPNSYTGHYVVVCGYHEDTRSYLYRDPAQPLPVSEVKFNNRLALLAAHATIPTNRTNRTNRTNPTTPPRQRPRPTATRRSRCITATLSMRAPASVRTRT